jgi:hypothetical protein
MRLMLKFTIPVERGNAAAEDGSLGQAIDALVERVKPEAAYFMLEQGKRAGIVVFNETDQSRLPAILEPFFARLEAAIEIQPVVDLAELRKGLR